MTEQPAAPWVTVADAARRLSISEKTIRRWITLGQLETSRVGARMIRINPADLDKLITPVPAVARQARAASSGASGEPGG